MACFTDKPYADWSYQFLSTLNDVTESTPISLGCYATMSDSQKRYQFYKALAEIANVESPLTGICFEELTEDAQWNLLNETLAASYTPRPPII